MTRARTGAAGTSGEGIALVVDADAEAATTTAESVLKDECDRLRDLIDEIADMDIGEPEIELRTIVDRCRQEQRRWQDGEEAT